MLNKVKKVLGQKSNNFNNQEFVIDFFQNIDSNKNLTSNDIIIHFGADKAQSIRGMYMRLFLDGDLDYDMELRNNFKLNWA